MSHAGIGLKGRAPRAAGVSAEVEHVKTILDGAGLTFAARNHAVRGADGSVEGEVDLVYTHENHVFAIEVSGFPHRGMRRRGGKALKEWDATDLLERLSSGLGLSAAGALRTVHVSLPWDAPGGEWPRDAYGGKRLGEGHMGELASDSPAGALSVFLEWNGVPHDPRTGRVLPPGEGVEGGGEGAWKAGVRRVEGRSPAAHEAVRAAALESNARLRCLIADVYARHRAILGGEGAGAARAQAPPARPAPWERRLLSARHLVLELWGFEDVRSAHYAGVIEGMGAVERDGLRMIMDDHEGTRHMLKWMRRGPAGRVEHDYGEFAGEIDHIGLAHIVHYAWAAHMLQDAVCRAIPRARGVPEQRLAPDPPRLPTREDRQNLERKYASLGPVGDMGVPGCIRMRDLQMSLRTVQAMLHGTASQEWGTAAGGRAAPMDCAHMARYAVLDIHGFIKEFCRQGIESVKPDILSRGALYARLHADHVAHSRADKLAGTGGMLRDNPRLLDEILLDMVEVDVLASRMLGGCPGIARDITPMTDGDIAWIDRSMEVAQAWGGLSHDHGYADPNGAQGAAEADP